MLDPWLLGLAASAVISVTFVAIAILLAWNLTKLRHWHSNPLAVGTFFIYLTCGGGHVVHTFQLLAVSWGLDPGASYAARFMYGSWHLWGLDGATAAAGVGYWMMRKKFPGLVTGTAVYEDLREREARAQQIHARVVEGLRKAQRELAASHETEGHRAVDETLASAKQIITDLLGDEELKPSTLRRSVRADATAAEGSS